MNLAPVLWQRYFDADGVPLAGGKVYSYQAGTTTPQATYTDAGGGTPNANPVVLDADGYADIWLDPTLSYKFVLKDSDDVELKTVDDVVGALTADSVGPTQLQDSAVTTAKIAAGAVTQAKLDDEVLGPMSLLNYGLAAAVASNELTITLKGADGNAPSASNPVKIPFRDATATTGTPVYRSVTSAITATISSGSTLGSTDGDANWIYVYALDNAGTVELAFSASKMWDEGTLQSTTAEGGAGAADSKAVLYANNSRTDKAIRLLGRIKSTQATAGTWVTAPSEISLVPFEQQVPRSEVYVTGGNGFGSTNTKIRRFVTTVKNVGSAVTYADSAADGGSFTINEEGVYALTLTDGATASESALGISLNSTELTTSIETITNADRLVITIDFQNRWSNCGAVVALKVGDIVRAHTDGTQDRTGDGQVAFRITKVSD